MAVVGAGTGVGTAVGAGTGVFVTAAGLPETAGDEGDFEPLQPATNASSKSAANAKKLRDLTIDCVRGGILSL